jgi:hypothetical protein
MNVGLHAAIVAHFNNYVLQATAPMSRSASPSL